MCSRVNAADSNAMSSVTASRKAPFASKDGASSLVGSEPQPMAIAATNISTTTKVDCQMRTFIGFRIGIRSVPRPKGQRSPGDIQRRASTGSIQDEYPVSGG